METRCELGNGSIGAVHLSAVHVCEISDSLRFSTNDVQRAGMPRPLWDACAGDAAEPIGCSMFSSWAPGSRGI